MLNDEVPEGVPEGFGENDKSENQGEQKMVTMRKADFLKLEAHAMQLFEANMALMKENANLVDIDRSLVEQIKKLVVSMNIVADASATINAFCIEVLKSKAYFQYFRYFLCVVGGSLVTWIIAVLAKFL